MKTIWLMITLCFLLCFAPVVRAADAQLEEPPAQAAEEAVEEASGEEAVGEQAPESETVIVYVTVPAEPEPETEPPTTADRSTPRLMVTEYSLDTGFLTPGTAGKLTVTLKNTNNRRAIFNLKVTLSDDSGDLIQNGMNTRFINAVYAGGTYTLEAELTARHNASVGRHSLTLTAEYEDGEFQSYSSSDTLYVDVRQTADLSFSGAELPAKVVEGDTVTVTLTLMNTGKAQLSNCKADFDVKGLLGGGTAFGGDLAPGESKTVSANLRAESEQLGATKGKITVTYEDEYGKTYTKTADVSTVIEKKVEVAAAPVEEQKKTLPWWLYGSVGLLLGGSVAFGVTYGVFSAKQRKQDELRL